MKNDYIEPYERRERIYRIFFEVSIIFKGLHALIEIIIGLLTFFVTKSQITHWVIVLTNKKLIDEPNDFLANFFIDTATNLSINTQQFIGWYLLSHGLVKIIPIYGLLHRQFWAYPTAIVILLGFVLYQLFRYYYTHSPWLIVFSIIDGLVIYLVIHEYRYLRQHLWLKS